MSEQYQKAEASIKFSRSTGGWLLITPQKSEDYKRSVFAQHAARNLGYVPYEGGVHMGFIGLKKKEN